MSKEYPLTNLDLLYYWCNATNNAEEMSMKELKDFMSTQTSLTWEQVKQNLNSEFGITVTDSVVNFQNKPKALNSVILTSNAVLGGNNVTVSENEDGTVTINSKDIEKQIQADWNQLNSSEIDYIKNKPQHLVQDENYIHTDNNFTNSYKQDLDDLGNMANMDKPVSDDNMYLIKNGSWLKFDNIENKISWGLDNPTLTYNGLKDDDLYIQMNEQGNIISLWKYKTSQWIEYPIKQSEFTIPTLSEVMQSGNKAYGNLDMNGRNIIKVDTISIDPTSAVNPYWQVNTDDSGSFRLFSNDNSVLMMVSQQGNIRAKSFNDILFTSNGDGSKYLNNKGEYVSLPSVEADNLSQVLEKGNIANTFINMNQNDLRDVINLQFYGGTAMSETYRPKITALHDSFKFYATNGVLSGTIGGTNGWEGNVNGVELLKRNPSETQGTLLGDDGQYHSIKTSPQGLPDVLKQNNTMDTTIENENIYVKRTVKNYVRELTHTITLDPAITSTGTQVDTIAKTDIDVTSYGVSDNGEYLIIGKYENGMRLPDYSCMVYKNDEPAVFMERLASNECPFKLKVGELVKIGIRSHNFYDPIRHETRVVNDTLKTIEIYKMVESTGASNEKESLKLIENGYVNDKLIKPSTLNSSYMSTEENEADINNQNVKTLVIKHKITNKNETSESFSNVIYVNNAHKDIANVLFNNIIGINAIIRTSTAIKFNNPVMIGENIHSLIELNVMPFNQIRATIYDKSLLDETLIVTVQYID